MAALTPSRWALVLLVALLLAGPGPVLAQDEDTDSGPSTPDELAQLDPLAALEAAEAAFLEADFEKALEDARIAAAGLDEGVPESLEPEARRGRLARALDVIAQSLYNLGNEAGMKGVIDRLVALEPGYLVDAETAGQRYVQRFDARRNELTGTIQVACAPLPCESVRIGERELALDEQGQARVMAGTLSVELRRHAFREQVVEGVEIAAGETKSLSVELVQIARDIVLRTRPAGVLVTLDGRDVGPTSAEENAGGASEAMTLLEVEPGVSSLVLTAPCLRRIERRIDVTLDRLDPSPIDLGTIELEAVHSELQIAWKGPAATFVLDASPVEPGVHRLCPGAHTLSVSVAGRRVWFEEITLADDEVRRVEPEPRPTLSLPPSLVERAGPALRGWNTVTLGAEAQSGLVSAMATVLGESAPGYPAVSRAARPEVAGALKRLVPEADLVLFEAEGTDAIGRTRRLVMLSPEHGAFESTLVTDADFEAAVRAALTREWQAFEPYVGVDLFERRDGRVVIAAVSGGSPGAEAGLVPGEILLSMGGADAPGLEDALDALAQAPPGQELVVSLEGLDGERRDAILKPAETLRAPFPDKLEGPFLLPLLARALVWRSAGGPEERMAGSLLSGIALAALGLDEAAARALDLASVDRSVDRAGDAQATITWLLEAVLRRLGETYADEVETRLGGMSEARLGGRKGPPLGWRPR